MTIIVYKVTKELEKLVYSVITNRLDYCNTLFINLPKDQLFKLQKLQNAAAKLVLGWRKRDGSAILVIRSRLYEDTMKLSSILKIFNTRLAHFIKVDDRFTLFKPQNFSNFTG